MSSTVSIASDAQFRGLLKSTSVVVTDFYADWCGPCKQIAPLVEQLAAKHSKPKVMAFAKVNVDQQQGISQAYGVTAMPTFLIFHNGVVVNTIKGADQRSLVTAIQRLEKIAGPAKPVYSSVGHTLGGPAGRPSQSLNKPFVWRWNLKGLFSAIISFLGLYFISLISLDPYGSAEASSFNIHQEPARPLPGKTTTKSTAKPGLQTPKERKVGTLADLDGES